MNTWKLSYNKFNPEEERLREALCTLGNGYFGTRGAAAESFASKVHYPGTYIAGVYNTLPTEIANRTIYNEDFVNCPNWLMINHKIDDGPWFDRQNVKILTWKVELNMYRGMLSRRMRFQDKEGRITLVEDHRIVSMANPHCGAMKVTFTPENYDGELTVRSGIDGMIINAGVDRYKQLSSKHLEPADHGEFNGDGIYLQMCTNQSNIQITEAMRTLVYKGHERLKVKPQVIVHGRQRIMHEVKISVKQQQRYSLEKLVSIYTSRDHGIDDNCHYAQETVKQVEDFDALYKPHQAQWKSLWRKFDVEVKGDEFVQMVLRLHTFHLLQVASPYNEDIDAGLPARGLHGEAYRGHIFWDELYVYPFYNLHAPEITRALLMYRYRRLGAAKDNAKQHGYKGAMYPWQTASLGDEQTQVIHLNPLSGTWGPDYSSLQRHVNIAIPYNVWTYYFTSGDRDFLNRYGAEMILEVSQFWSSIAHLNKKTKRYEIHGVMGPDEFHEKYPGANKGGLNNNAYTNVMVAWVLEKSLHILDNLLNEEDRNAILLKTGIKEDDVKRWREMSEKMYVPVDKKGLIHQFDGYMDLEELNWDEYRRKYDNIHRIDRILKAEGLSPDSYKVAKQADTLMLFYVLKLDELKEIFTRLGYSLTKTMFKKNFEYYIERTSHGSTLSLVVHAYLAELLNHEDYAEEYFIKVLRSDVYDIQGGTTQEGIHCGVMGGSLDLFLKGFGGVSILKDRVCLNPKVPKGWKSIKFSVRYKDTRFHVQATHETVSVKAELIDDQSLQSPSKIPIEIYKKTYQLVPGKTHKIESKTLFVL